MSAPAAVGRQPPWPDAGHVSAKLAEKIGTLALELLPAGRRRGGYWTVGSVENERGGSMWVHLVGQRAGNWNDAATGEFGDALDLVSACMFRGNKSAAYHWALAWLGLTNRSPVAPIQRPAEWTRAAPADPADADEDDERRRRGALRMWLEGAEHLAGTPVEQYLAARCIDLARLTRPPRALRCHPALPHRDSGQSFPAMVAAINDVDGTHIATHRTWLAPDAAGIWRKALIQPVKMAYGSFAGGCIRIARGASGKPLRECPPDDRVILAEGIETALSIAVCVPAVRVLCAVSLGNLGAVVLPPQLRTITLAADNDRAEGPRNAFQRAVDRHLEAGRRVQIVRPQFGKDFNDVLQGFRR